MSADEQLAKCGAVMYDAEIIAAIPQHGEVRDPSLSYCGGWEDYDGMGISVMTAYDFVDGSWLVYLQDNISEFRTLVNSRSIIMGFNSERFDNNLLRSNHIHIESEKSYDLWRAIVDTQPPGQRKGFSLDNMLGANDIPAKTGLGSDAPKQAQKGLWGELINYCLSDTRKQVQLLRLACNGTMRNPHNKEYMSIKLPWEQVAVDTNGIF